MHPQEFFFNTEREKEIWKQVHNFIFAFLDIKQASVAAKM